MYNNKNTRKNTKFQKKEKNPNWGLTHPPISEFFSAFLNFLTWQNP